MRAFLLAAFSAAAILAQDPLATQGFQHFYNLEYDEAIRAFEREIARAPQAPDGYNHLLQAILFRELLRVGALESELVSGNNSFLRRPKVITTPEVEKRFFESMNQVLQLTGQALAKNPNDTAALYQQGVAYGFRATWGFLVRKAWREALRDSTASRRLQDRVAELDPGDWDARLTRGVHDYMVGSLPWHIRMLGFLVGFRGDKNEGIRMIQQVAAKGRKNRIDAEVFLCALYRRESRWRDAGPLLDDLIRRFPRNYLLKFEKAQMHSALGEKDQALAILEEVLAGKRAGSPGYAHLSWERIYFHIGNVQFWYRDYARALDNLGRVTRNAQEVDLNTATLAWMRMGQIYDLTNRRAQAQTTYRSAIAVAPEADAAREAKRYLSSPYRGERESRD